MLVQQLGPSSRGPAAVLGQQGVAGHGRGVCGCSVCIFERGKLILSDDLKRNKVPSRDRENVATVNSAVSFMYSGSEWATKQSSTIPGEWKDVKNKLLHLYAIGFGGLDLGPLWVHKGHFLNRDMLLQFPFKLPVWDPETSKKGHWQSLSKRIIKICTWTLFRVASIPCTSIEFKIYTTPEGDGDVSVMSLPMVPYDFDEEELWFIWIFLLHRAACYHLYF